MKHIIEPNKRLKIFLRYSFTETLYFTLYARRIKNVYSSLFLQSESYVFEVDGHPTHSHEERLQNDVF